jgi:hypothetical protein
MKINQSMTRKSTYLVPQQWDLNIYNQEGSKWLAAQTKDSQLSQCIDEDK